jgi:hypothetical protein
MSQSSPWERLHHSFDDFSNFTAGSIVTLVKPLNEHQVQTFYFFLPVRNSVQTQYFELIRHLFPMRKNTMSQSFLG